VPLCPYQFITSFVIAPSRDLPGRVKLAFPRLPAIGNDIAILDSRADEPLSYFIAAGALTNPNPNPWGKNGPQVLVSRLR
jgi:hypothetical protein